MHARTHLFGGFCMAYTFLDNRMLMDTFGKLIMKRVDGGSIIVCKHNVYIVILPKMLCNERAKTAVAEKVRYFIWLRGNGSAASIIF